MGFLGEVRRKRGFLHFQKQFIFRIDLLCAVSQHSTQLKISSCERKRKTTIGGNAAQGGVEWYEVNHQLLSHDDWSLEIYVITVRLKTRTGVACSLLRGWKHSVYPGDCFSLRLLHVKRLPFFSSITFESFLNSNQYPTYGVANPGYVPAGEATPGKFPEWGWGIRV